MDDLKGRWALVTGASSGLGTDFARELALRGAGLTLVARRKDRLQALARELVERHHVDVQVESVDLIADGAIAALKKRLDKAGRRVDVLVNNAGYGLFGAFAEIPWERERDMLQLDIVAVTHLTKLFVPSMLERRFGRILNVASIGAYQPSPLYASYAAAKSYVLNFSEALSYELRGTGVSCTALSPGITATEFLDVSGQTATAYQRLLMMKSPDVARAGVDAMMAGVPSVVPGAINAVMAWSNRLVPRRLSAALAHRLMK